MEQAQVADMQGSRARILAQARALFAARGYRGLSMREIAEAVGISKAGIYYHFRDKEDLFSAIIYEYLANIAALIDAAQTQHPACRDQVAEVVRQILAQPAEERALVRLASQEMAHLSVAARQQFDEAYAGQFVGRLQNMLAAGMGRGELRALDPGVATWCLLGMMYPYFYPSNRDRQSAPPAATVEALLTIYFDGLAAP